jgi:hypothetical protein
MKVSKWRNLPVRVPEESTQTGPCWANLVARKQTFTGTSGVGPTPPCRLSDSGQRSEGGMRFYRIMSLVW